MFYLQSFSQRSFLWTMIIKWYAVDKQQIKNIDPTSKLKTKYKRVKVFL